MTTRTNMQKTWLDDDEMSQLLALSTANRRQRGPLIRELINTAYCQLQAAISCQQTHPIAARANVEGPRQGHIFARRRLILPNKALGQPTPHLRV